MAEDRENAGSRHWSVGIVQRPGFVVPRPQSPSSANNSRQRRRLSRSNALVYLRWSRSERRALVYLAIVREFQPMILPQFYLNCLAHASYLVRDERAGLPALV